MTEESIFAAAIEIERGQKRKDYLEQACQKDAELRSRIESLIAAHEGNHDLVDRPIDLTQTQFLNGNGSTVGPGSQIGRYKLLQEIGEGGFGTVFMAEQIEPVRRRVALKVIKPGMDSKEVIARFEAERQALAMMDHPNIAKVLDAGTTESGHPYFVMEMVKGIPITTFADNNKLSGKERLQLFVKVCHAVQHAHQKGVIHRDIKPTNVLVTLHDGEPVPKIIDFGVSKALNQQLTEKTLFTKFGQIIGTPQYMSPEQAELSGLDVDTRSDVYALGVLLYELLTGRPPFDAESLREAGFDEMRRIIREQDPQKPSECMKTLDHETASTVAESRSVQPRSLSRFLQGELDWIVMRSLEKNRERRFESVGNFALDIQRYLDGETIQTKAPTMMYYIWKRFKRHRAAFLTAALVFVVVFVAAIVATTSYFDARKGWKAALVAEDNLQKTNDKLIEEKKDTEESLAVVMQLIRMADPAMLKKLAEESETTFNGNTEREHKLLTILLNRMLEGGVTSTKATSRYVEVSRRLYGDQSRKYVAALVFKAFIDSDIEQMEQAMAFAVANDIALSSRSLSLSGALLFLNGKSEKARSILNSAIAKYKPDDVAVPFFEIPHFWLAEIMFSQGQDEEYRSYLSKGITEARLSIPEYSSTNLMNSAFSLADNGFIYPAIWASMTHPENDLTNDPNFLESLRKKFHEKGQFYRGTVYAQKAINNFETAIKILARISQDESAVERSAWPICFIGRVYLNVGDYDSYEKQLRIAVERAGNKFSELWFKYELAIVLFHHGNKEEAIPLFQEVKNEVKKQIDLEDSVFYGIHNDWGAWAFSTLIIENDFENEEIFDYINTLENASNESSKYNYFFFSLWKALKHKDFEQFDRLIISHIESCDFGWCVNDGICIEDMILQTLFANDQKERALNAIRHYVEVKEKQLADNHPQLGLSRLRYAEYLIDNEIKPDLARSYLTEAKSILAKEPLVPNKYREQLDELLHKLTGK